VIEDPEILNQSVEDDRACGSVFASRQCAAAVRIGVAGQESRQSTKEVGMAGLHNNGSDWRQSVHHCRMVERILVKSVMGEFRHGS
jgi:hypothetical protein